MKRQRGRNRGGGGGGGKPQHNVNRAFESNGPDNVKIRGNAQHVFEKYQQLARDAMASGDRVLGENYLQHAEHYFRVLRAVQPNRPASEIIGRDAFASGFDIDFEDESGAQAAVEEAGAEGGEGEGQAEGGNGEARGERPEREWQGRRDERDRFQGERRDERSRDERPRDERPREDRPRDERREDRPREDRRDRRDRFRDRDRDRDRDFNRDRPRDPMAVVEPEAAPLVAAAEAEEGPRLRSQDGSVSHAPAFLQARPERPEAAAAEEGETRRPRRRRAPRSFEGGEGDTPAPETEEA
jgi:hypothetical protein